MKNDKIKYLLCFLFFSILALITFRCVFGVDNVFASSDVNIGGLAHRKNAGLDLFFGFFRSYPLFGATNHSYSLFNVLVALTPLYLFLDLFYGGMLITGSLCMVWYLKIWNRSWLASIVGALVAFWFNSIMLASGGHVYKIEVLVFSTLAFCLVEKALRSKSVLRSIGFSLFAGLTVGVILVEQQDVALLAGLILAPYTFFRLGQVYGGSLLSWLRVLFPVAIVASLISGATILKSYNDNIANAAQVQGGSEKKWNYVTQWSMVPEEWPDLIASGWSGWGTGRPDGPYWGSMGQSVEWKATGQGFRNFKITSKYLGVIPFILGLHGFVICCIRVKQKKGRVFLFWGIAGLVCFLLSFGKFSFLYKLFYELPLVGNIRDQSKFLDLFQICLGVMAAYGVDLVLEQGKSSKSGKVLWVSSAACGLLMLFAGVRLLVFSDTQKAVFSTMGYEAYADVMLRNMSNAWLHGGVLALICSLVVVLIWKDKKSAGLAVKALILVLAADSLVLTHRYFKANDLSGLKNGNAVMTFLKQNQGADRIFYMDQSGIYNSWLALDSTFHGLNFFNIWQMNRMPAEYEEFLHSVGKNQLRLWELSAVKFITAPATILEQFKSNPQLSALFTPRLNYQVPTAQGMRNDVVLEFNGGIPRFALIYGWDVIPLEEHCSVLASQEHNPHITCLLEPPSNLEPNAGNIPEGQVEDVVLSKKDAIVRVNSDMPAILRFSQRHQPGWQVLVDGKAAELLKIDFLCMGVSVPPGEHVIEFRCPRTKQPFLVLLTFILSLFGGAFLICRGKEIEC